MSTPKTVSDLLALLAFRNEHTPGQVAYELHGEKITFAALWRETNAFAAHLQKLGLSTAECVLIAMPNHAAFFPVFYGIQLAGGIPVPLFPDSGPQRLERIAGICGARRIVTFIGSDMLPGGLEQIDPEGFSTNEWLPARISPESIAFIQFTSGSTGDPKGVPITHANLLTNIRQLIAGMEITSQDVFVSWLPVYHDMGLILMTMVPFYLAARLVLLPTSFVNLRQWLATIETVRGTFTASPDFGYRLALRYAPQGAAYDLASLRVALNAAEMARPETIASFEKAFGLNLVMTVGYGLAEATVGVSMTKPGEGVRVDGNGFASVGRPFPQVEMGVMTRNGEIAKPGEVGEVLVRSAANTGGYFGDPGSQSQIFTADGFLKTGDTGYIDAEGELFITGRIKELVKHAGRTLAPRELEAPLDNYPGLRTAAAVSLDLGGLAGEQALVIAELARSASLSRDDLHVLAVNIMAEIHASLGIRPARVYIARPRTIPLTENGKLQRSLLRARLADGSLQRAGMLLYPDYFFINPKNPNQ